LIGNAVKFTQKGYISVGVKVVEHHKQKILLEISIKDTGIGIPEIHYQTIFEQFSRLNSSYQGEYQGSGLGLYIVKKFIEEMNGQISVSSKVNNGTVFRCLLPFTIDELESSSSNASDLTDTTSFQKSAIQIKKHILLIEDDIIAQKMAKLMLEDFLNCTVSIANNEKQALAHINSQQFDLILVDIGLPNTDGFTLTKKIRALNMHYASIPIFGLTAHIADNKSQFEGMNEILFKPLSEEICMKLSQFLTT
jgi:K+-sensing histidine kinase KdpD